MKILFVQDSLGAGGAERSNADLWYYLREKGVTVKIIVLGHRDVGVQKEILKAGFSVHFLKRRSFVSDSREIAGIIREFKPAVVHSALYNSNMRVRLAKLFASFYHVESLVNCTYAPIRFKDPRVSRLGLYLAKYFDYFSRPWGANHSIAITEEVARHYQELQGVPSERLSVIYRGRNENKFLENRPAIRRQVNQEFGLAENQVLLIHVGRQEYQKGHIYLLESLLQLYRQQPETWQQTSILFCGRTGNASADIDAFMKQHPYLADKIHWLGHRHDIPQLLAASDAFIFPSLYEGLGGALIEAQAAALPVVCSDISVLHEVVNQDENALMFPVANADKLWQQLKKVVNDNALRSRMREESLKNFNQKFRLNKINEQMLNFYRRVVMKEKENHQPAAAALKENIR